MTKDNNTVKIIVPDKNPMYANPETYSKYSQARQVFETAMIAALSLPKDWNDYLQFRTTDDFISLQEKGSYKDYLIKRFKRGKEAIITDEIKERALSFINSKKERNNWRQAIDKRNDAYRDMLCEILKSFTDNSVLAFYHWADDINDAYIEIALSPVGDKEKDAYYRRNYSNGKIYIKHTGEITTAKMPQDFNSFTSINAAQQWIEDNRENDKELNRIALLVKAALPIDFFTT